MNIKIKKLLLNIFIYAFGFSVSDMTYTQPQYDKIQGIDVCPGPFEMPKETPSYIVDYYMNNINNPICVRTAIGLPSYTNMSARSVHKYNYPGPVWSDYLEIYPNYSCGSLYNDASRSFVCGNVNFEDNITSYPGTKPNFNTQVNEDIKNKYCVVGSCDNDATTNCNPLAEGAYPNGGCVCPFGGVNNPLGLNNSEEPGCFVEPRFNWIIGVCQGAGCNGAYDDNSIYLNTTKTKPYKNIGSQLIVNYVAAYNFDSITETWKISQSSSFNTQGKYPPYDTIKAYGGLSKDQAWLNPQPGGSAQWSAGFHPVDVEGVGYLSDYKTNNLSGLSKGIMFVLSTKKSYNFAWYMLNQATLDRGPGSPNCYFNNRYYSNCWASGNAGEIDFLESAFAAENGDIDNYRRLYLNNFNQFGRCFPGMLGQLTGGWGSNWERSSMMLGSDPFLKQNETKEYIFVAVVDKIGTWVYRIPGENSSNIWKGMYMNHIDDELSAAPTIPPVDFQPCGVEKNDYCVIFIPNCYSNNASEALSKDCAWTDNQGFCNNWFALFEDTHQWQFDGKNWTNFVSDPYISSHNVQLLWNKQMSPYQCKEPYTNKCER